MKGVQTFHISGIKGARPFPLSGLHFEGIKGSLVEAESVNAKLEIHQSEAVVWLSCPGADIKDSWVFHKHTLHLLWLPERLCLLGYSFFFPFFFGSVFAHSFWDSKQTKTVWRHVGAEQWSSRSMVSSASESLNWMTHLFEIFEGKYLDRTVENGCLLFIDVFLVFFKLI